MRKTTTTTDPGTRPAAEGAPPAPPPAEDAPPAPPPPEDAPPAPVPREPASCDACKVTTADELVEVKGPGGVSRVCPGCKDANDKTAAGAAGGEGVTP